VSVLHLFLGDLRLDDNPGLTAALGRGATVGGLILDPWHRRGGDLVEAALADLRDRFAEAGGMLILREGRPAVEALRLLEAGFADTVTVTLPRVAELAPALDACLHELSGLNVEVRRFDDAPTVTPYPLLDDYGRPERTFAAFRARLLAEREPPRPLARGPLLPAPDLSNHVPVPPVAAPPSPALLFRRFAAGALAALGDPAAEFAAGGSGLSTSHRFGLVSMRALLDAALALPARAPALGRQAALFLDRLILGEFCRHLARAAGPSFSRAPYDPRYAAFPFENRREAFDEWVAGETGVPVVDAAMRELARRSRLPHPLREIAAAWLVQILHMDWRLGDRHFRDALEDYDEAVSAWHWQRLAGCGPGYEGRPDMIDIAARYRACDPEALFVRRRLPALRDAAADFIHHLNGVVPERSLVLAERQALYLERLRTTFT